MKKPIHVRYFETRQAMKREKPRSSRRIVLQEELQDLLTRQLAKESGFRRRRSRR